MRKKNTVNTKEHKPQNNGKRETRHIHSTREANLWREERDRMLSLMVFLASVFDIMKEEVFLTNHDVLWTVYNDVRDTALLRADKSFYSIHK